MSRPAYRRCVVCGEGEIRPRVTGRAIGVLVPTCTNCHEEFISMDTAKALDAAIAAERLIAAEDLN